jgi:hypothetical protein
MKSILNLGSGKINLNFDKKDNFIINLDRNYFTSVTPLYAELKYFKWLSGVISKCELDVKYDIFEFLEVYKYKLNKIIIYRLFEHLCRDKILYFIYLLSTVTENGSTIDLISPDFKLLSKMILNEDINDINFGKNDIIISTEIFNEVSDPHMNITTIDRIKYLFEYEGRFEVINSISPYKYDGRDIYFRSLIRRKPD